MNIKKFLKNLLMKRGYHLLRRYYYDFDGDESIVKILSNVDRLDEDLVVLDVGANVGQSVDRFRRFIPSANIYSFEPNPEAYTKLSKKMLTDSRLKCFNVGVGEEVGSLTFYKNPDSGSNSFNRMRVDGEAFELSNTEMARKNHNLSTIKEEIQFNTPIDVPVQTLNSFALKEKIHHVDILKIDTQGFEHKVLLGASDILEKTLIVEAEIMFADSYEDLPSLGDIENLLVAKGFALWEIPYIGKFATDRFNRLNFIDAQFVNMRLFNELVGPVN